MLDFLSIMSVSWILRSVVRNMRDVIALNCFVFVVNPDGRLDISGASKMLFREMAPAALNLSRRIEDSGQWSCTYTYIHY